ncbi:M48 family metalloprotease [Streptomyces alkaliterrae]|uniref:M48 family metalloprotease n=1 Tax=Streptomyces alkaliterrae TaxID=2213162 RepID=UPI002B20EC31|nr:M48 family metalloprotease [Streptomyces alkaliterrae]
MPGADGLPPVPNAGAAALPAQPGRPPVPGHPMAGPQPPGPAQPAEPHPHEVEFEQRRAVVSDRQRRTDATAIGGLLLYVPNFLCSLLVVGLIAALFGGFGLVLLVLWLLSGLLVFHRPTEGIIARRLLKLRRPTPEEHARLEPVWREVTIRAGVEGRNYELWVEDNDHDLNAVAAAGHIVGVTRFALSRLPSAQLAAVLAHELGHHVGGHAWSSLLGYWYALPGKTAWRVLRLIAAGMFKLPSFLACLGVVFVLVPLAFLAFATVSSFYGLPLLVLVVPYLLAAVGRRSELRADEQAAALGFAPMLAEVLRHMRATEQHDKAVAQQQAAARGMRLPEPGPMESLLSTHPEYEERLHRLQPYLVPPR